MSSKGLSQIKLKNPLCGKKVFLLLILLQSVVPALYPSVWATAVKPNLRVGILESMAGKNGIAERWRVPFEQSCQCRIQWMVSSNLGQMINRLQRSPLNEPPFDVIMGLDALFWNQVKDRVISTDERSTDKKKETPKIKWAKPVEGFALIREGFIPVDYGILAWMTTLPPGESPKTIQNLTETKWKKRWISQDPRTSSPGFLFLLWTNRSLGNVDEAIQKFWKSRDWLTLPASWSDSYALFTRGEADLVWSYTTSEAYHREYPEDPQKRLKGRVTPRAIFLNDSSLIQIEGMAVVKGASSGAQTLSQKWIRFVLSEAAQKEIPQTQWMFPAIAGVSLPVSFQNLPEPKSLYAWGPEEINESTELLKKWLLWVRN